MGEPGPESSERDRRHAALAAARWRLPFGRQAWRGATGNWAGAGAGSSLDFQDHRDYVPGDDPRHIHWQAFARTGALTMKIYRADVAPTVEVAVDVSASMALSDGKRRRTEELAAFCVASADRAGAPVRLHAIDGRRVRPMAAETVRAGRGGGCDFAAAPAAAGVGGKTEPATRATERPTLALPWRAGAMRVWISDLLFPGDPAALLAPLATGAGLAVVLAPGLAEEADLPWRGNVELTDCESGAGRRQRVDAGLAARYREAYARHFALWREACRRRGVLFARVPVEPALAVALGGEARAAGAVEAVG
jgi:uncharacterized protein (DUF58 family)